MGMSVIHSLQRKDCWRSCATPAVHSFIHEVPPQITATELIYVFCGSIGVSDRSVSFHVSCNFSVNPVPSLNSPMIVRFPTFCLLVACPTKRCFSMYQENRPPSKNHNPRPSLKVHNTNTQIIIMCTTLQFVVCSRTSNQNNQVVHLSSPP